MGRAVRVALLYVTHITVRRSRREKSSIWRATSDINRLPREEVKRCYGALLQQMRKREVDVLAVYNILIAKAQGGACAHEPGGARREACQARGRGDLSQFRPANW